nr:uncharacterized protein LOC116278773 [Vicugna pacos]
MAGGGSVLSRELPGGQRPLRDLGRNSWSRPNTLKFLLGHRLRSSGLLFLLRLSPQHLCGNGDRADLRGLFLGDGPRTRGTSGTGVHHSRPTKRAALLLLADYGSVLVAQRRVWVPRGGSEQVHIRRLCERLVVSPGISSHQKSRLREEGCLDLLSEGSRNEAASGRSGLRGSSEVQHSSLAGVPGRCDAGLGQVARAARSRSSVLVRFTWHFGKTNRLEWK